MGLLNDVKKAEATAPETETETEAKTKATATATEDKSEKKIKAKERKAAKREALKTIIEYLQKNPIKELENAVKTIGTPAERQGGFAPAFTAETLFGDKTRINAVEVFTKFKKGYPEMKKYMKKWAEKGIKVSLDVNTQDYVWVK